MRPLGIGHGSHTIGHCCARMSHRFYQSLIIIIIKEIKGKKGKERERKGERKRKERGRGEKGSGREGRRGRGDRGEERRGKRAEGLPILKSTIITPSQRTSILISIL